MQAIPDMVDAAATLPIDAEKRCSWAVPGCRANGRAARRW